MKKQRKPNPALLLAGVDKAVAELGWTEVLSFLSELARNTEDREGLAENLAQLCEEDESDNDEE